MNNDYCRIAVSGDAEQGDVDYKQRDTQLILNYIVGRSGEAVPVKDIIHHSGAERLRVYPALFELEQEGRIVVTEREEMGAARVVISL